MRMNKEFKRWLFPGERPVYVSVFDKGLTT